MNRSVARKFHCFQILLLAVLSVSCSSDSSSSAGLRISGSTSPGKNDCVEYTVTRSAPATSTLIVQPSLESGSGGVFYDSNCSVLTFFSIEMATGSTTAKFYFSAQGSTGAAKLKAQTFIKQPNVITTPQHPDLSATLDIVVGETASGLDIQNELQALQGEVHIVSAHRSRVGLTEVEILRDEDQVLFLCSFRPIQWTITGPHRDRVRRVIVSVVNSDDPGVSSVSGIEQNLIVRQNLGAYAYEAGTKADQLKQMIETLVGRRASSFQMSYKIDYFSISNALVEELPDSFIVFAARISGRDYVDSRNEIEVNIGRIGVPIVLVLCSYEGTQWNLHLAPGVILARVLYCGYADSYGDYRYHRSILQGIDPNLVRRASPGEILYDGEVTQAAFEASILNFFGLNTVIEGQYPYEPDTLIFN